MTVNLIAMALMPISHGAAWYLVVQNQDNPSRFYQSVAAIAAFYCAWALYKIFGQGDKKEKGYLSMGFLMTTSLLFNDFPYGVMGATVLVILNFAAILPFFANRGVSGIVKIVHKEVNPLTLTWGYIFLAYIVFNIVLWSYVLKVVLGFSNEMLDS